ncbi:MAG: four helix bundle protein [Pirellulales bacterium]
MNSDELKARTKRFALRIVKMTAALPRSRESDVIARQVLRSGTSVGANYREAVRASSKRQFISTLEICLREADETIYWLELLGESGIVSPARLTDLLDECNQIGAILTATVRTAKATLSRPSISNHKSAIINPK